MNATNISTIHVECGVEGDSPKNTSHLFCPVFKVQFLPIVWKPPPQKEFSICFTSKQAVNAFKLNVLPLYQEKSFWHSCYSVSAVGQSTAAFIEKDLPSFLYVNSNKVIYPKEGNGLLPLLLHLKKILKEDSHIVLFTSQIGKTVQVVTEINSQSNFMCEVVPVYTLQNIDEKWSDQFFGSLFQKLNSIDIRFVFYCRSGQILNCVIKLLMKFFNVTIPVNLPPFIFFSTWEKSARHVLLELNLIDRDIS
jgi:hypothetical protein